MQQINPKEVLADVAPPEAFWFYNGIVVRNIYELLREIKNLDEYSFVYHSNPDHDDFAKWINDSLGDYELANKLRNKPKNRYVKIIESRIRYLEILVGSESEQHNHLFTLKPTHLASVALTILIVVSLLAYSKITSNQDLLTIEDQIYELRQQDLIMQRLILHTLLRIQNSSKTFSEESPMELEDFFSYQATSAPADRINEEQIKVFKDRIVVFLENASWARFESTGSMMPTIGEDSNAIEIKPLAPEQIKIGDIISYKSPIENAIIIHRVVETGDDTEGWFAITKGDNNKINDPYKVRFSQIERVVIGIIY